jgi:gliding motility-associated-like protein
MIFLKKLQTILFALVCNYFFAQSDECATATPFTNVSNFCVSNASYSNSSATQSSNIGNASCWNTACSKDVWFSFTSVGTDVLFTVNGQQANSAATLKNPNITLYSGNCSALQEELCKPQSATNSSTVYKGGLILGNTYYLRISTTSANAGTFNLCINNYTPAFNPSADCVGATYLCDKSPVSVGQLSGSGATQEGNIMNTCFSTNPETNSSWYKWTCQTSGSLTMILASATQQEDIDWIIFELPNGINNCAGKTPLSCNSSSCVDPDGGYTTGLSTTETDNSELSGCSIFTPPISNSYCQALNIVAGKSYALLINNFSTSSAFTLSWGGTSTFQGPKPIITPTSLSACAGETITFSGSSSTNYSDLSWIFNSATPATSAQISPVVTYPTTGVFPVILTAKDAAGCSSNTVVNVTITSTPAPTVNNVTICQSTSTSVSATGLSNAIFNWYSTSVGGILLFTGSTYTTPNLSANTSYWVSQTVNNCESARVEIKITITSSPTPTSTDVTICAATSANLIAVGQQGATFKWYSVSTGGTSLFTGSSYTTPTLYANTSYWVSQTINGCESNRFEVKVTLTSTAVPNVTNPTICNASSTDVVVSGLPNATFNWYSDQTSSIILLNGETFTTPPLLSTTSYWVSQTIANCESERTQVTITIISPPLPIVEDQNICLGNSTNINATGISGGTFNWYLSEVETTPTYTGATYTTTAIGTNTSFWVTQVVNTCESEKVEVTITIGSIPPPNIVNTSVCQNSSANLMAVGTAGWNILWYTSQTGGTSFHTGTTYNTPTLNSVTSYWVSQELNACESNRVQISVTINTTPPPTVINTSTCSGTSSIVTASGLNNSTFKWYASAVSNSVLAQTASYTSPIITVTSSYWVSQIFEGCESTRTEVIITPFTTIPPTSNNIIICENTSGAVQVTGLPNAAFKWYTVPTGGSNFFTGSNYTTPTITAPTSYWISQTVNNCESARIEVKVSLSPPPVATIAGSKNICIRENADITITATPNSIVTYKINGENEQLLLIDSTGISTFNTGSLSFTTIYELVKVELMNDSKCSQELSEISTITVTSVLADFIVSPISVSYSKPTITLINTSIGAVLYTWNFGDGNESTLEDLSYTYENPILVDYPITLTATSEEGCTDIATGQIHFIEELIYYIPNTFTPDSDEFNPIFKPIFTSGYAPDKYSLEIFNRWGELIFTTNNFDEGWDGTYKNKDAQVGTYTWKIHFKLKTTDEKKSLHGHVNLLK